MNPVERQGLRTILIMVAIVAAIFIYNLMSR